jgi:hypothetical protein
LIAGCGRVGFDAVSDAPRVDALEIPDLVAYYPFDDDPSGGIIACTDAASVGTCTPPRCPTLVDGHKNGAGLFTDGVVTVNNASLVSTAPYTISLWARFDVPGNYPVLFSKPASLATSTNVISVGLDESARFFFETTTGGQFQYLQGPTATTHTWYHVAATWDGAQKGLFVDGTMYGAADAAITDSSLPLYIGNDLDYGNPVYPHEGPIDEVRVYRRALSLDEIQQLAAE